MHFPFEPVQLDLEAPDLFVELRLQHLAVLRRPRPPPREHLGQPRQRLLLPLRYLHGMDAIGAGQLVQRLLLSERRRRYLRLELRRVSSSLLPHPRLSLKPSSSSQLNVRACPVSGVHYSLSELYGARSDD